MTELNNKKLCESCFAESDSDICPKCGFNRSEYTADPLVLPMGTRLNESIVIGRCMGKGGFGVTYLGYDLRMRKTIAVKEYYPNGIAYRIPAKTEITTVDTKSSETFENGAEKFYAEAEMVAQFNGNPNIVSVYDYFRENNTVYLVMEYISGITLKAYVKKHGRLTDGQALYVMDKIAAALSITHSAGVLHRDISPDNIMVCMDGKVKLIDFGAARQIMTESSSNLTVVMKPGYTPIEQYTKKGRQGAWTDIYSLGVSVYYALTEVIIEDPYTRMDDDSEFDENRHGINSDLWKILKKCTMVNASDRYGSAIDLRKALRSVCAPIKPQPLPLDENDLKIEETAVAPDIFPEKNPEEKDNFPVTAASDIGGDKAIEIFEDSTAAPAKRHDKKKSKKITIAAACAAAVVIIGIIGILFAANKPADEDDLTTESMETNAATTKTPAADAPVTTAKPKPAAATTTETKPVTTAAAVTEPEKTEKPLYIKFNDGYPGDWIDAIIYNDSLKYFEGDIKITLDIGVVVKSKWASFMIKDDAGKPFEVKAYNNGKKYDNTYQLFGNTDKFAFVIKKEEFRGSSPTVVMTGYNVWIKGAAIEDYDPDSDKIDPNARIIQMDSKYQGNWEDSSYIPKKELESFGGDVRVTLDLDIIKEDLVPDNDDNHNNEEYWVQITPRTWGGRDVVVEADYICPCYWFDRMYVLFDRSVPDKFTFVISRSEIEKLDEKGLCFAGDNFIVKSAALEKA